MAFPVCAITAAAFLRAFYLSCRLAQTSDSAQALVAAHGVVGGNLLLSGWHFPFDDYYFTDTLPYAALEWIAGSRPVLLALVPALTYALFVLAALLACLGNSSSRAGALQSAAVIALVLASPAWMGNWNPLLMSDMHMASVLFAFAALCMHAAVSERAGVAAALALPLLTCLAAASDPFSVVIAFGPALAIFAVDAARGSHAPRIRFAALLLGGGTAAGLALPFAIAAAGGFTTEADVATGISSAAGHNVVSVASGILTLFGLPLRGPLALQAEVLSGFRSIGFLLVVFSVAATTQRLFGKFPLLDRLLCAAILTDLAACLVSAQFAKGITPENNWSGGPPMRFLLPAFLFGAVLAARRVPQILSSVRGARARAFSTATLATLAVCVWALGASLAGSQVRWIDDDPPATAARWLRAHNLTQGVGEYWSANLVTAMSGSRVSVRSVVPRDGKLANYVWAEDARFYGQAPRFMIWQDNNKTGVTAAQVAASYAICRTESVAGYRIAILYDGLNAAVCKQ